MTDEWIAFLDTWITILSAPDTEIVCLASGIVAALYHGNGALLLT